MPRESVRAIQLLEAILEAGEIIDTTDQSRAQLSQGMDDVRAVLAEAYGDDFEDHLAEKMGEGLEDEDENEGEEEEEEN